MKKIIIITFLLCNAGSIILSQNYRYDSESTGDLKWQRVRDLDNPNDNYYGAAVNGKIVVPVKYHWVTDWFGLFFAYTVPMPHGGYEDIPADFYTSDGKLLASAEEGFVFVYQVKNKTEAWTTNKYIYQKTDQTWYDENGNMIFKDDLWPSCWKSPNGEIYYHYSTGSEEHYGLSYYHNGINHTILAPEFENVRSYSYNMVGFKLNGYWGVINKDGKMIIPLDRHYTKIEYSRTLKMFTFEKEGGYKGECDATGKQTNITKVSTPAPKPQPQKQKTTTQEPAPAPTPTPQTQPQPRQPQPVQEWVPCSACNGSGQCHICLGGGNSLQNPNSRCYLCSGTGKCTHCAGHGGHYETRYR